MAGTVTFAHNAIGGVRSIVATCTADAADGSYPATALPSFEGEIITLRTNPGATAPTANYDIVLTDADGVDRLQGLGANRHTTTSEEAAIFFASTSVHPVVSQEDVLSLTLTGNSVNSAIAVVTITYQPA